MENNREDCYINERRRVGERAAFDHAVRLIKRYRDELRQAQAVISAQRVLLCLFGVVIAVLCALWTIRP